MKNGLFDTNRLEAFSDGVFAIIITIMVIEFHRPAGTNFSDLAPLIPTFLAYTLSFIYIAIYWNNHHHLLKAAKGVNGSIMWANMGLLFSITLIPFATDWMGENYHTVAPTILYGGVLFINGITYYLLQQRIIKTMNPESAFARTVGADRKGILSSAIYAPAILLTFLNPLFAQILFGAVAIMWIVPDRRIEKALQT